MEPEGGLKQGESVKKHFRPSPWKYIGWYFFGFLLLPLIIGPIFWIAAELHRRGHNFYITNERVIREFKFLKRDTKEATFDLITETSIDQPLTSRMVDVGDVNVKTASGEVIEFGGISGPKNVKNQITSAKHRDKNEVQKVEMVENGKTEYCPDCGEEVSASSKFCSNCGHELDSRKNNSPNYSQIVQGSIKEVKEDIQALKEPDYEKFIEEEEDAKNRETLIEWMKKEKNKAS